MLVVDKMSRKPIYEQLVEGFEREIVTGLIREQQQLPSIRELSVSLSVNPNTVQKAVIELDRRGVIVSIPGRGIFVAENAVETIRTKMSAKITEMREIAAELARAGIPLGTSLDAVKEAYGFAGKTESGEGKQ